MRHDANLVVQCTGGLHRLVRAVRADHLRPDRLQHTALRAGLHDEQRRMATLGRAAQLTRQRELHGAGPHKGLGANAVRTHPGVLYDAGGVLEPSLELCGGDARDSVQHASFAAPLVLPCRYWRGDLCAEDRQSCVPM